uniref:TOD1/MUCI70 glycosyltransferase-like domain-containing protein n=2 Tax=Aegilops tauschii subsp. strangulata TaxID=200361 RepID=A0A453SUX2_AEGTS
MQQPENISTFSKDIVCFFMFLDEETEAAIKKITTVDNMKRIRLWRVVVVHNLILTQQLLREEFQNYYFIGSFLMCGIHSRSMGNLNL